MDKNILQEETRREMLQLKNTNQVKKLQEGSRASEQMEEPVNCRGAVGTTWEPPEDSRSPSRNFPTGQKT